MNTTMIGVEEDSLSRVRFFEQLDGPNESLQALRTISINTSISCSGEQYAQINLCRERKLFVKAALQLIDSHEAAVPATSDAGNDAKFDLIRSGILKKGVRSSSIISSISISNHKVNAGAISWKSKYVELRHGQFAYYDDTNEDTPLMGGSLHSYHPNFNSAFKNGSESHRKAVPVLPSAAIALRKIIPLYAGCCTCRAVRLLSQQHSRYNGAVGNGGNSVAKTLVPVTPGNYWDCAGSVGSDDAELPGGTAGTGGTAGAATDPSVDSEAFEICQLGGQRRLFLTSSVEECARWVRAINIAMVAPNSSTGTSSSSTAAGDSNVESSSSGVPPQWERHLLDAGSRSVEGAVGPYAGDISRYIQLQQRLHSAAESEDTCRALLQELVARHAQVRVPVAYIKGKCSDSRFAKAATTSASAGAATPATTAYKASSNTDGNNYYRAGTQSHVGIKNWISSGLKRQQSSSSKAYTAEVSRGQHQYQQQQQLQGKVRENVSVEHSQMWKDLQRDEVCVNGERVAGNTETFATATQPLPQSQQVNQLPSGGAEAIIGLLVRHIADAAEQARTECAAQYARQQLQDQHQQAQLQASQGHGHGNNSSSSGVNSVAPSVQGLSEAQMMQCARSILMLCNRTQSGGDTYYCVDSLLSCKLAGNQSVFILAPVSNQAEPLAISVDVVEVLRIRHRDSSGQHAAALLDQRARNGSSSFQQGNSSAVAPRMPMETPNPFTTPAAAAPDELSPTTVSYSRARGGDSPCNDYIDALAASAATGFSADSPPASIIKPSVFRPLAPISGEPEGVSANTDTAQLENLTNNLNQQKQQEQQISAPAAEETTAPTPTSAPVSSHSTSTKGKGLPRHNDQSAAPATSGTAAAATTTASSAVMMRSPPSSKTLWEIRPGRSPRRISDSSPPQLAEPSATMASSATTGGPTVSSSGNAPDQATHAGAGVGVDGVQLRRRSSRKSQLKLNIDDHELSYCDSGPTSSVPPPPTSTISEQQPALSSVPTPASVAVCSGKAPSSELRADFAKILQTHSISSETRKPSSGDSDSTTQLQLSLDEGCEADDENTAGEGEETRKESYSTEVFRESCDTVPVSLICVKEPHRFDGSVIASNSRDAARDDSTVISDITFDTTAAFSQSTVTASYFRNGGEPPQQQPSSNSDVFPSKMHSVEKDKKGSAHKPKSILKMLSYRLTPRHPPTPSGPVVGGAAAAASVHYDPHSAQSTPRAPSTSRFRFESGPPSASRYPSHPPAPADATTSATTTAQHMRGSEVELRPNRSAHKQSSQGAHSMYKQATLAAAAEREATHNSAHGSESDADQQPAEHPTFCIRLRVHGESRYRVCSADPQGVPEQDNWATMVGVFSQTFFIPAVAVAAVQPHQTGTAVAMTTEHNAAAQHGHTKQLGCLSDKLGKLAMTDRLVTISVEGFDSVGGNS